MKLDFFQNFIQFDEIDSTNDFLKKNYKYLSNFTIVKTGFQTKGRGQFDKVWESDRNQNILISILFKKYLPSLKNINHNLINTIINTLKEYGITDATFKYPNDIIVQNNKIAGILIETKFNNKKFEYIIIGIGININQEKFNTSGAISLYNLIKRKVDLNEFMCKFFEHLLKTL